MHPWRRLLELRHDLSGPVGALNRHPQQVQAGTPLGDMKEYGCGSEGISVEAVYAHLEVQTVSVNYMQASPLARERGTYGSNVLTCKVLATSMMGD